MMKIINNGSYYFAGLTYNNLFDEYNFNKKKMSHTHKQPHV